MTGPALVAFANRLPVVAGRGGLRPAAGGLVTALRPALEQHRGAWVGWDGGVEGLPPRLQGLDLDLLPVSLTRREVADYYHGFANRTLWPLLHGWVEPPVFDAGWWRGYCAVNERFAAAELPDGDDAVLWVHDYHLMLLPALLRERCPGRPIGFFLHTPFPSAELWRRLPWRAPLVEGLLGADVVSFQTEEYRDHFLRSCRRSLVGVRVEEAAVVTPDGRRVLAEVHPISIDARDFVARARGPAVERVLQPLRRQFEGRRVLLGVDRLDYTKGILERLRAIELLLERRPELRRDLAFVQIAVPTRGEVREYASLRRQVEELVGRINGRFTEPGRDVPLHYLYRGVPGDRLLAYYRLADVCLVTPLRDGMNLVAKEYVTVQGAEGGAGVLVLSEFTGAAAELAGALTCNPWDVEGLADAIAASLDLAEDYRRGRIADMATSVDEHDVFWWVNQQLSALEQSRE
ncbi:MAG TPA: trehalose-6-phosphate synthase [Gaiellaceae bacterium]|nr:trehalose-6-phosphate synthase [Gaiellaceae bacterium]